ncbi:MAG: outer membrane lipoprotein carrier protein LolA [Lentimicrobiaceae bacterium]|jgi:outer membrane lipoprotein-sorting protein|nr:outer membrane lipoprotein carrier protein LolA [Lentimicrobiaceae bacterium]
MKKTKFFTLIFLFASSIVFGQQNANELLKAAIEKMQSYETIEIVFDYKMQNKTAGINEVKSGNLFLKGNAYNLSIDGHQIICDGKTIWSFFSDNKEVMVSDVDQDEEAITPDKLFTTDFHQFESSFVTVTETKPYKTIELKSDENKDFDKIWLEIDEKKLEIRKFTMYDDNGTAFIYDLKKFQPNVKLTADYFYFDTTKYPDVEVIDMR